MAKAINSRNVILGRHVQKIPLHATKAKLIEHITPHLADQCNTQLCWKTHPTITSLRDSEIEKFTFREEQPEESDRLKTFKLQSVMKQYERKYPDFVFFGPVPLNFKDFSIEVNHIQLRKLYNRGVRHVGVIFNTKPIPHKGEHWICAHIHLSEKPTISYFDSYALAPPKEIVAFFDSVEEQLKHIIPRKILDPERQINIHQHQQSGNECGVYCMYFIIERVKGRSFKDITSNIMRDTQMKAKRSEYMLPESAK